MWQITLFSVFYITVNIYVNIQNLSSHSTFQTKDEDDERPGSKESVKLNMKAIGKFKHLAQNVDNADAVESSDSIDESLQSKNRFLCIFYFESKEKLDLWFNDAHTPTWPSYQIRFFSPERNILAEAQDALKNAFLFSGIVPNMECHIL